MKQNNDDEILVIRITMWEREGTNNLSFLLGFYSFDSNTPAMNLGLRLRMKYEIFH